MKPLKKKLNSDVEKRGRKRKESWVDCIDNHSDDPKLQSRVESIAGELMRKGVRFEDFKESYGSKTDGSPFNKTTGFPTSGSLQPLKKSNAFLLHSIYGIDLHLLLIDKSDESAFFKSNPSEKEASYFLWEDWKKIEPFKNQNRLSSNTQVFLIPVDTQSNQELKYAYEKMAEEIGKAKYSIKVWECTFKGDNDNPGRQGAYDNAQAVIFETIFQVLGNQPAETDFRYYRKFYLSLNHLVDSNDRLKVLVDEISFNCLEHVVSCLLSEKHANLCSFSIMPDTTRYKSYCVVDSTLLLTEDYIKQSGTVVPRVVTIDNQEAVKNYIISITQDDDRATSIKIESIPALRDAVEQVIIKYQKRVEVCHVSIGILRMFGELTKPCSSDYSLVHKFFFNLEGEDPSLYRRILGIDTNIFKFITEKKEIDVLSFGKVIDHIVAFKDSLQNRLNQLYKKQSIFK